MSKMHWLIAALATGVLVVSMLDMLLWLGIYAAVLGRFLGQL